MATDITATETDCAAVKNDATHQLKPYFPNKIHFDKFRFGFDNQVVGSKSNIKKTYENKLFSSRLEICINRANFIRFMHNPEGNQS